MSAPFDPFCGLKKRPEMLEASFSYSPPLSSSPLLAAATIVKGILEAADAEKEHRLLSEQGIGHRGDADGAHGVEGENEGQRRRGAPQGTMDPQRAPLLLQGLQPSRRPVRPFRKRGRYVVHSSDGRHVDPSGRVNMLQLDAVAAAAAALSSVAAASGVGTLYTRQAAINSSSSSFSAASPRRNRQRTFSPPASSLASSAIRLLSSETYLRRLFVTSALAHVLSLDACLPRTMPAKREASARVSFRGAFGRERGWNGHEMADRCGGQEDGDVERGNVAAAGINHIDDVERANIAASGINNNDNDDNVKKERNENEKPLNAPGMPYDTVPFTRIFPVTLIDSAGQRWTVKYVTTRRDNLHSGRLADGWEKFCRANRLRVGDSVEFTRLESHELSFYGLEHGREAVARVVAYKKRL